MQATSNYSCLIFKKRQNEITRNKTNQDKKQYAHLQESYNELNLNFDLFDITIYYNATVNLQYNSEKEAYIMIVGDVLYENGSLDEYIWNNYDKNDFSFIKELNGSFSIFIFDKDTGARIGRGVENFNA